MLFPTVILQNQTVARQIWFFFIWLRWFYGWVEQSDVSHAIYCRLQMEISWGRQRYTILWVLLHKHKSNAHSSKSNSCRKHLQRSGAHMSMSLFAFLQRNYISRKTYSYNRPPDAEHWTYKNTHMAQISVSAASSSSLIVCSRKSQPLWIHSKRKHRISTLSCTQWTSCGADDLLTYWSAQDITLNCFLSPYLLGHSLITGWAVVQASGTTFIY